MLSIGWAVEDHEATEEFGRNLDRLSSSTVAIRMPAMPTSQSISGSLPIAISLTPTGSGRGWFTSFAGAFGLTTFSRTAMNEVYCVGVE